MACDSVVRLIGRRHVTRRCSGFYSLPRSPGGATTPGKHDRLDLELSSG